MLWASARSIREERSKQRCAMQDFSRIRVSLIKGKSGWRIGSAEALGNPFLNAQTRIERALINFVIMQLRRYVHGEVPLDVIYSDAMEILEKPNMFVQDAVGTQKVFALRLMSDLGYIAPSPVLQTLTLAPSMEVALQKYLPEMTASITKAVADGAMVSHL